MRWRYRNTVLAVVALANFSQLGARLLISPVVPAIIAAFGVSKGRIGLVLTVMWATYALVQYPSGILGDRYGERTVVLVALAATGIGGLLLALAPSFALFGLFGILLGAGSGLYFTAATSLLTKTFDRDDRGQALSIQTAAGSGAGLIGPAAAAYVGVRYGWRPAVALGAPVVLVALVVFAWRIRPTVPERPDGRLRDRFEVDAMVELLSRPGVAYTTVVAFSTVFTWGAFSSFFPTFLIEFWNVSTEIAGVAFGAIFFLSAVVQPAFGRLSDAVDRDAVLAFSLSATAVGLLLAVTGSTLYVAVAAVLLLGVGLSWPGVLQARFMDQFTDAERGSGFGLVRTVYMLVGSVGSVVTGATAEAAGWPVAYGIVAGLLLVVVASLAVNRALDLGL